MQKIKLTASLFLLLLTGGLLAGCANVNPTDSRPPYTLPSTPPAVSKDVKVTYNYGANDTVRLSNNNIKLKVGQRLILEPAAGFSGNTRFTSSGEYFFGDIMRLQADNNSGRVIFTAENSGKGKLQIIPNTTDVDHAADLWVTVE